MRHILARQGLARAPDAGGKCPQIRFRLLGKQAEHGTDRVANISKRRRFKRLRNALRKADAFDQMDAQPAKDGSAQALPTRQREERRDAGSHGVTHHVGAGDLQMVEQGAHVVGHERTVIESRLVDLARGAVSPIIERDHASAGPGQGRDPSGMNPIHFGIRAETVDEDDRLALAFVEKGDLDAVVRKALHADHCVRNGADHAALQRAGIRASVSG